MTAMNYTYDDGGRAAAGFKGRAGDCVARAVAIASQLPYEEVYKNLADGSGAQRKSRGRSARNGISVKRKWFKDYMASIGFTWTPTMRIGSGCTVHLTADELPRGRLVVAVSKHYTAVIDGVIRDTYNPSADRGYAIYPPDYEGEVPKSAYRLSNGGGWCYAPQRCVYGYWSIKS